MNLHWISAVPGGWWTIGIIIAAVAILLRLLYLFRPQRRVKQPTAWDQYEGADRSKWGKDQWDE